MAEFTRAIVMQGFDAYQTPRWQMVPLNGERFMILRDGSGLTVTSQNPGVVSVTEVAQGVVPSGNRAPFQAGDRFFKLSGSSYGITRIEAKNGAVVVSELECDVKLRKTVTLGFNFVRDTAGHATVRQPAATNGWINSINYIYTGQTNIKFIKKSARTVTASQNLGAVVRFSSHLAGVAASQHEWDVVTALGDTTADMNFFFVWEYEQDLTPFHDHTDAGTLNGSCIFEDYAGSQVPETLAHEIGHFLGCDDHYDAVRKRDLMYGITDVRGIHVTKQDANIMNP